MDLFFVLTGNTLKPLLKYCSYGWPYNISVAKEIF